MGERAWGAGHCTYREGREYVRRQKTETETHTHTAHTYTKRHRDIEKEEEKTEKRARNILSVSHGPASTLV